MIFTLFRTVARTLMRMETATKLSLFDWQARAVERAASFLAHWLSTTHPERLAWHVCIEGQEPARSPLQQVQECITVNEMFARLISGEPIDPAWSEAAGPIFVDLEDAQRQLEASAQTLASAIRGMSDADLERTYQTAFGPMTGAVIIELPLSNMHYHAGQINFIQVLYGDREFSVPPTFSAS